jgi:hypothetical protein
MKGEAMINNTEVYKSFVLFDYFEPKLCAEIRSYLTAAKNPDQLETAQKLLRDTLVYLLNERQAQMKEQANEREGDVGTGNPCQHVYGEAVGGGYVCTHCGSRTSM